MGEAPPTAVVRPGAPLPAPRDDWAYFFDVDGTLLDMAAHPDEVHADTDLRASLRHLLHRAGGAVALISGRAIADLDRIFGEAFPAAGQHGGERRGVDGRITRHGDGGPAWDRVREEVARLAGRHAGLLVEDKGLSLALHYRRAPALASFAHQLMRRAARPLGDGYVTQRGKRVIELKPAGIDKGAAIRAFLRTPPFAGRTPLFLGDDVTDEYGFAVVNALAGYSVKVGRGRTVARWRFADVGEVRRWLACAPSSATEARP